MDWLKLETNHILNSPLTDQEIGQLVKMMCLIAFKERVPSDGEFSTEVKLKKREKLLKKLEKNEIFFEIIQENIINSVKKTKEVRKNNTKTKANSRSKDENVTCDTNKMSQHREDKIREDNKEKKIIKKKFLDSVFLSDEEVSKLISELGEFEANRAIEILDAYKGSSGKTYKSDYKAIKVWVIKRLSEETSNIKRNSSGISKEVVSALDLAITEKRRQRLEQEQIDFGS